MDSLAFRASASRNMRGLNNAMIIAISHSSPGTFDIGVAGNAMAGACGRSAPLPGLGPSTDSAGVHTFLMPRNSCVGFLRSGVRPVNNFASTRSGRPLSVRLRSIPGGILMNASLRSTVTGISTAVAFRANVAGRIPTTRLKFITIPGVSRMNIGALITVCGGAFGGRGYDAPVTNRTRFGIMSGVFGYLNTASGSAPFFNTRARTIGMTPRRARMVRFAGCATNTRG